MRHILLAAVLAAAALPAWADPACTETVTGSSRTLNCSYKTRTVVSNYGIPRVVQYQLPAGTPPPGGWPAVLMYQPSVFPTFWTAPDYTPAGAYHQVRTIEALLDAGYAVIAPPTNYARLYQFWDTNAPGVDSGIPYTSTDDYGFLTKVINGVVAQQYGPINGTRLYATGMSSGGYNTSRMAVSFQGRFRALAVQSGSYATCLGPMCNIPAALPWNHPPTLFLHGANDYTVPINTMQAYYGRLQAQGVDTRQVLAPGLGHEYLPEAPEEIVDWFNAH